ncbi:MAG: type II secretion system F family protein [Nevskia sp.]|nr:type II secretion system F family protein [Nevskia sp.]
MTLFHYQALQDDGRPVAGQVEASSERAAYRMLLARRVRPTSLQAAVAATGAKISKRRAGRLDYIYALKELHALIAGGVPIAEAVSTLAEATENATLAAAYLELNAGLRRGERFSTVFARCFAVFPGYIHTIIESGQLSGRLAEALADAAAEMEHSARVRAELRNALLYPCFLISFGLLAIFFVLIVVVPKFAAIFHGKYDKIPFLSYVVIAGGMWFRSHLLLTGLVFASGISAAMYAYRQPRIRELVSVWAVGLPFVNRWFVEVETARWAAVLARLLENRVPLLQSLELARKALFSPQIRLQLDQVEREVRGGKALAKSLEEFRFLPSTALTLVRVGERAGNLPEMMRSVSSIYDELVRRNIKGVLTLIEPVAIVLIGGAVALVAVSIFMAISSINNLTGLQ